MLHPFLERVGARRTVMVIAEAGVNHDGDLHVAKRLIEVAFEAGADAVKFQTFDPARLASARADQAEYQKRNLSGHHHVSQLDMLRKLALNHEAHHELAAHAKFCGIPFCSTPFDEGSATFLRNLKVPFLKLSSGEITNLPLLRHAAKLGLPVILSTGMSDEEEVDTAVRILRGGGIEVALLHCVSNYPAEPGDMNLRVMPVMASRWGLAVGLSDHTLGVGAACASVALGGCIVEKHFTLDRRRSGPDHAASLEPDDLRLLVRSVREASEALGKAEKRRQPSEEPIVALARRSLHWARDLSSGASISAEDLVCIRPATGLPPGRLDSLIGRHTARAVVAGLPVCDADMVPTP